MLDVVTGAVYPSFGIVFGQYRTSHITDSRFKCTFFVAKGIVGFSLPDPKARRERGDMSALWFATVFFSLRSSPDSVYQRFFVIALLAMVCIGLQNYLFGRAAATLTARLRSLSFRAILRQDSELFVCRG
jgi:ATP-binding cassette subfamily B (MDR/TAP) protein 1